MRARSPLAIAIAVALGSAAVHAIVGCLDVTPIVLERDASAGADTPCLQCLEQPQTCNTIMTECRASDPRCGAALDCMRSQACLDLPTLDDKIKCGLPCAQDAGVVSLSDPIVDRYLVALVQCGQDRCPVPCNLVDGGPSAL